MAEMTEDEFRDLEARGKTPFLEVVGDQLNRISTAFIRGRLDIDCYRRECDIEEICVALALLEAALKEGKNG